VARAISARGSAGRHIYQEGVTADPARIEPTVDIVDGAEGVVRAVACIEIPVQVVHGAQRRRSLSQRPITVVDKEHLPPLALAVNDFPAWARIERTRRLIPGTGGIVPIG
jgi:hypothetical protein